MSALREAAEMALEAMEDLRRTGDTQVFDLFYADKVIPALRQALAQPEQEPVAWLCRGVYSSTGRCPECQPLYTTPPKREWVGLDEDRVAYLADKYAPPIDPAFTKDDDYWRFYQEIEAELKEKNGG